MDRYKTKLPDGKYCINILGLHHAMAVEKRGNTLIHKDGSTSDLRDRVTSNWDLVPIQGG